MSDWFIAGAFLALPYVIYAVIQTVRGQTRPNAIGILLACTAVIVPIALLTLNESGTSSLLTPVILANAVIVLVISGVIMILDYRRPGRDLNHSFGLLGLGVSILLIAGIFTTPFTLSQFSGTASAQENLPALVSNPAAIPNQESAESGALQAVIIAQTGLTIDEVLEQISNGAKLASLIAAANGDVDSVTAALTQAIEEGIDAGTLPAPMIERMGGDAGSIASSAISGEIPGMILNSLLGGSMPGPQGGFGAAGGPPAGFAPPDAADSGDDAAQFPGAPGDFAPPAEATSEAMPPDAEPLRMDSAAASPTPAATETAASVAEIVIAQSARDTLPTPTPFIFDAVEPTSTPVSAETNDSISPTVQPACSLIVNFNLNLREAPNPDGAWILTIPAYTTVTANGQTADNWWQITYQGESGWISGEYVSPATECAALPVLS